MMKIYHVFFESPFSFDTRPNIVTSPFVFCFVFLQKKAYIKVVFLKVGEIDTLKEFFVADVFIQIKWREPSLDRPPTEGQRMKQVLTGALVSRVTTCPPSQTCSLILIHVGAKLRIKQPKRRSRRHMINSL